MAATGNSTFSLVDFLKIFSYEIACPNEPKLGRTHLCKICYKDCSFCLDLLTSMATKGNSCNWLVDFKKYSPLKLLGQMNWNLVGSIYDRSSMKIAHIILICLTNMAPTGNFVSDWPISKHILLCNHLAKWNETWYEASYGRSLWKLLILSRTVNKHDPKSNS